MMRPGGSTHGAGSAPSRPTIGGSPPQRPAGARAVPNVAASKAPADVDLGWADDGGSSSGGHAALARRGVAVAAGSRGAGALRGGRGAAGEQRVALVVVRGDRVRRGLRRA